MRIDSNKLRFSLILTVVVASLGVAAGCGTSLGDCPTNSSTQQTAGAQVLVSKCESCHSTASPGGAADGKAFDNASTVKSEADNMWSEAEGGDMPPSGKLSDTDLEALRVYLACQK